MKLTQFTLPAICCLLFAAGCKKEPIPSAYCGTPVIPVVNYPLVKTSATYGQFGWSTDGYEYDSIQRVIRKGRDFFCYEADTAISDYGTYYFLGADGIAIGHGYGGPLVMNYVYDNNGYRIKDYRNYNGVGDTSWSNTDYIHNTDSNLAVIKQVAYDKYYGNHENTQVYTYYTYPNTIGYKNTGMAYLGKDSRNLVKTCFTFKYNMDSGDTLEKWEFFYTYTFTAEGYVDSLKADYIRYQPQYSYQGTKPPVVYTYY